MFHFQVTSYCNQLCVFCGRTSLREKAAQGAVLPEYNKLNQHMRYEVFTSLLDKLRDHTDRCKVPKNIIVHGVGEPLMWPHYKKGIKLCREYGFETQLFTNGILLTEEWCDFLLEHITDKLKVSVNGLTDETLRAVTGTPLSNRIIGNCKTLVRLARERETRPKQIIFGFVKCKENAHEAEPFRKMWDKDRDIVTVMTPDAINFDIEGATPSQDIRGVCPLGLGPHRLGITPDGTLHPCCHTSSLPLGDLKENSFADLLEGSVYQRLSSLHRKGELGREPVCNVTCLAGSKSGSQGVQTDKKSSRIMHIVRKACGFLK